MKGFVCVVPVVVLVEVVVVWAAIRAVHRFVTTVLLLGLWGFHLFVVQPDDFGVHIEPRASSVLRPRSFVGRCCIISALASIKPYLLIIF